MSKNNSNNIIDDAIKSFKEEKEHYKIENAKADIKKEFTIFKKELHITFKNINNGINMAKKIAESTAKDQLILRTEVETAVKVIKFFFGGGVLIMIINVLLSIFLKG